MSQLFTYICTRTTVDPFVPPTQFNQTIFARDVSDAFTALVGGHLMVGRLTFFPVQRSVPNHLLCDGAEVARESFPELYEFLLNSQGTPANPANFVLPNFVGTLTPAATATPEVIVGGTVSTPPPEPTDPGSPPITPVYGAVDSGGREPRFENEQQE